MKKLGLLVMPLMAVSLLANCDKTKTYHVKFTNGNQVVDEKDYKENEVIIAPEDPAPYEKDHKTYTFEAWLDGETKFEDGLKATQNYNFNAKFDDGEETIYYVYFKENEDDKEPDVQRLAFGDPIRIPGDLSDYKGDDYYWHRFTGWYDGETKLEENAKCKGNQTFIAKFEKSENPVTYFATFHAKDSDKKVGFDVDHTIQDIPETDEDPSAGHTQYWLIGDNKVSPGTKDYDFTAYLGKDIEVNYSSIANPHTITLKVNGQDDVVINSAFGEKILSEEVPQKEDDYKKIDGGDHYYHHFTGKWTYTQGGTDYVKKTDTLDDVNTTIYAEFTKDETDPIIYAIRFLDEDEKTVLETKEIYCPDSLSITAPDEPRPGYTSTWSSGSYIFNTGDPIVFGDDGQKLPIKNYDFVLNSAMDEYTITYVLGDDAATDPGNPTSYNVGENISLLAPSLDGFTFKGWYLGKDENDRFQYQDGWKAGQMTGDITLYADWHIASKTLNEYTWEGIDDISKGGTASKYFDIGETKTVSLKDIMGTRDCPVRIIDFNRDIIKDSNNNAGITFELADVIVIKKIWGEQYSGAEDFNNGELNADLNKSGGSAYDAINAISEGKLMAVIKTVKKDFRQYSNYNWHDSNYTPKLFPLSYNEINGDKDTSYNYYKGADDAKRKKDSSYWLRSPTEEDQVHVMFCDSEGRIGVKEAGRTGDVAPAFCI